MLGAGPCIDAVVSHGGVGGGSRVLRAGCGGIFWAILGGTAWGFWRTEGRSAGVVWFTGAWHDPFSAPCGMAAPVETISGWLRCGECSSRARV